MLYEMAEGLTGYDSK